MCKDRSEAYQNIYFGNMAKKKVGNLEYTKNKMHNLLTNQALCQLIDLSGR